MEAAFSHPGASAQGAAKIQARYERASTPSKFSGRRPIEQILTLKSGSAQDSVAAVLLTQKIKASRVFYQGQELGLPEGRECALILANQGCLPEDYALTFTVADSARREGKGWVMDLGRYDWSDVSAFEPRLRAWQERGQGVLELSLKVPVAAGAEREIDPTFDLATVSNFNLRYDGSVASEWLGVAVAIGDLNGDGVPDLAIGGYQAAFNGANSGSVYVIYGPLAGGSGLTKDMSLAASCNLRLDGATAGELFGAALAIADVNGDLKPDLIVGAYHGAQNARVGSGSAYVIYGGAVNFPPAGGIRAMNLAANYNVRFDGGATNDQLGAAVAAGDLSGDGISDLVLGGWGGSLGGKTSSGVSYVVNGGAVNFPASTGNTRDLSLAGSYNVRFAGGSANDQSGYYFTSGDYNGDTKADLAIGAQNASYNGSLSGSVYVVYGGSANFPATSGNNRDLAVAASYNRRFDGTVAFTYGDTLGWSLASGDLNRDGLTDLALGASGGGQNNRGFSGSVYVLYGGAANFPAGTGQIVNLGLSPNFNVRFDGNFLSANGDQLGYALATGDLNGDAGADLIMAGRTAGYNARAISGSIYSVFGGSANFPPGTGRIVDMALAANYQLRLDGAAANYDLGDSIAVGDLNFDGKPDLVMGAAGDGYNARAVSGSLYVVYAGSAQLPQATPTPSPSPSATATPCAIGFDSATGVTVVASSSFSYLKTCSGANRLLIVQVTGQSTTITASSITYNGVPLTLIRRDVAAGSGECWYLVAPATGSNLVTVTLNSPGNVLSGASSYTGVDQASPIGATNFAFSPGTTAQSVTLGTTVANSVIFSGFSWAPAQALTLGGGQTQRYLATLGSIQGEADDRAAGAIMTYTLSYSTVSAMNAAAQVVELKPASCAAATATFTGTATPTSSPTATPTSTRSNSASPSPTASFSASPSPSATFTFLPSPTFTPTPGGLYSLLDQIVTNGTVFALTATSSVVYLGGSFTLVGPASGQGVVLDAATGFKQFQWPKVTGKVLASLPDGSGGWYLGGSFGFVAGMPRNNLAHVLANGSLDPAFDPNMNGGVNCLALNGTSLYAGGLFTTVNGGLLRNRLAAVDAATGVALGGFDPNMSGTVWALALSGGSLYAGGLFATVNGATARNNLAAVNAATGAVLAGFNPNMNGQVNCLAVNGSTLYAGGLFTTVNGGTLRNRLAAVDAATGAVLAGFDSNMNNTVNALALSGTSLYAGGVFTTVNGATVRNNLAAVNAATGAVLAGFDPNLNGGVNCLALNGASLYAGGLFTTVNGGTLRNRLAGVNAATGTVLAGFDPNMGGQVNCLALNATSIFAGGSFNLVNGGTVRNRLAAVDAFSGAVLAGFDPNMGNTVNALALNGSSLYAGGAFTTVNGSTVRNYLAAVDASTGLALAGFNPNANGTVFALALDPGGNVFLGGFFTSVGGQVRNNMAKVNGASGALDATFNPNVNNYVYALAMATGGNVTLGGTFTSVGGQVRNNIAKVNGASGVVDATFNPNADGFVTALAIDGPGNVYMGGGFFTVGGLARNSVAKVNGTNGTTDAFFNPNANASVGAMALDGSGNIYLGGTFTSVGGQARNSLALVNATSGAVDAAFNPNASPGVRALALSPALDRLYAGGDFTMVAGQPASYYAALVVSTPAATPTVTASPTATPSQSGTWTMTWTPTASPTCTPSASQSPSASPTPCGSAAILGVCPACAYTTLAAAYAAAGPCDIIELRANINEGLVVNKNIAGIQSDATVRTWDNSIGNTFQVLGGLTRKLEVRRLNIVNTSLTTNPSVLVSNLSAGMSLRFFDCRLTNNGLDDIVYVSAAGNGPDQLWFERCKFEVNGPVYGLDMFFLTATNSLRLVNSTFYSGTRALDLEAATTNSVARVYHCTFYGASNAVYLASRGDFQNNLFIGNSDDLLLTGGASVADFKYNAFQQATTVTEPGLPASNLTGVVGTAECVSPAGLNFHLLPGAQSRNAGTATLGVADDQDGLARPQEGLYDMGAFEYNPAVPTATPTWTMTATRSATVSPTPTISPFWTPSPSPSSTPTVSLTLTPTASPTATLTPTQTWTLSATPSATGTSTPSASSTASPALSPTPTFTASPSPTAIPTSAQPGLLRILAFLVNGQSPGSEGDEYVQIFNPGPSAAALTLAGGAAQIKVGDEISRGGSESMYGFPNASTSTALVLAPYGCLVVAKNAYDFNLYYGFYPDYEMVTGVTDTAGVPNMVKYASWSNGSWALANGAAGDEILLLDSADAMLDQVAFGVSNPNYGVLGLSGGPFAVPGPGISARRSDPYADTNNMNADFVTSAGPPSCPPVPSSTPTPSPSVTATATGTSTATAAATPTVSASPTASPSQSGTGTMTWTPTATQTGTVSATPSWTSTATGTGTPSNSPTTTPTCPAGTSPDLGWAAMTSMFTARDTLAGATVNNIFYALGGSNGSTLGTNEAYDPAANTWSSKAPMPTARVAAAAATVNGILYVIGGTVCCVSGTIYNVVEAYDPVANTWSTKAPMPTPRQSLAAVAVNGIIYAIGGYNLGNLGTVEAYDPVANTWSSKAPMPTARTGLGAREIGGTIYAVGGNNVSDLGTLEAYDPVGNLWSTKASMPTARRQMATGVLDGILYVSGGNNGVPLSVVEAYNPVSNTWSARSPLPGPRWAPSGDATLGALFLAGGFDGGCCPLSSAVKGVVICTAFSATPTSTPTSSPTSTPSSTPSLSPSSTPTVTGTGTPSTTLTSTPTATPTSSATWTQTSSPTFTPTATGTWSPTQTRTATCSSTPSVTATSTPSFSPSITPSATPISPCGPVPRLGLKVRKYQCQPDQSSYRFFVTNYDSGAINLSALQVRFWIKDSSANLVTVTAFAGSRYDFGGANFAAVTGYAAVASAMQPACGFPVTRQSNWQIALGAPASGLQINGNGGYWEGFQIAIHDAAFKVWDDETDDFSQYPALQPGGCTDNAVIGYDDPYFALYYQGILVPEWNSSSAPDPNSGTEPPCAASCIPPTATPSYTVTGTSTPTPTFSPSSTATPSASPTATPSVTCTASPTATVSASPSVTRTATLTATQSATNSFSPTSSPTPTISLTWTETPDPGCYVAFVGAVSQTGLAFNLNQVMGFAGGPGHVAIVSFVAGNSSDVVTGVSLDGLPMALYRRDTDAVRAYEIWYLANPAPGGHTISLTQSASVQAAMMISEYRGIDPAQPILAGAFVSSNGTTSISLPFYAPYGNSIACAAMSAGGISGGVTPLGPQSVLLVADTSDRQRFAQQAVPNGGMISFAYSLGIASNAAIQAFELKPGNCTAWTPTSTSTVSPSPTASPTPMPPTNTFTYSPTPSPSATISATRTPPPPAPKMDLEVWQTGSDLLTHRQAFKITNRDSLPVALNRIKVKLWIRDPLGASAYSSIGYGGQGSYYDGTDTLLGPIGTSWSVALAPMGPMDCGGGRMANIALTFSLADATLIPAGNGYYRINDGNSAGEWHRNDFSILDTSDDYSRSGSANLPSTYLTRVNNPYFALYVDDQLVCEYGPAAQDPQTGLEPCGIGSCPAPSMTPSFTPSSTVTGTGTATPTATQTPTPTLTPTETPSSSGTATPTATQSASPTSTQTPTWTPTASPSATPSATLTATASASPTATPTDSPTMTHTPTWTLTASPSATPSATLTATASASPTATPTDSPTMTHTPTWTPTASPTATPSATLTFTASASPTATRTNSPTPTPTPTWTPTASRTPTPTATMTSTFSASPTATPTDSPTMTPTPTWTPTASPSATPTATLTSTASASPSATPTHSPTLTWTATWTPTWTTTSSPSATPTATASASPTGTRTDSPTPTPTPTWTPTASPTATPSATLTSTASASPTATSTDSPTATPTPTWTPTASRTATPTATMTSTFSASPTATPTDSPTMTQTPTWTPTASPSATPTATLTSTASASPTATLTDSPTMTGTPTWTQTASPSATPTATLTATASASPTATRTNSPTPTPTPTWTPTASPTATPSATLTFTASASPTATPTNSPSMTQTPTWSQTASPTATTTSTLTATPSASPTATRTDSPTMTHTPTGTPSATQSVTVTDSPTLTATRTATSSATQSVTPTDSPSATASWTASASPSPSPTLTGTGTATPTSTPTLTATPPSTVTDSPSATPTWSPSPTASPTLTASRTPSFTASPTASASSSPTPTPTGSVTDSPTPGPSPTITQTFTITNTPLPTATAEVPVVTSKNVFNPEQGGSVDISMKAPGDGWVTVKVYDINGDLVRPVLEADIKAGLWFQAKWDGKNGNGETAASGIYFVSVKGAGIRTIRKVLVIK